MARSLFGLAGPGFLVLICGGCLAAETAKAPISDDRPFAMTHGDADPEMPRLARAQRPEHDPLPLPTPPSTDKLPQAPPLPSPSGLLGVAGGAKDGKLMVSVRAWVNGHPIFDEEVMTAVLQHASQFMRLPEPQRSDAQAKIFNAELNQMIERELILQDAYRKLSQNPKFLDKIKAAAVKHVDKTVASLMKRNNIKTIEEINKQMGGKEMLASFRRQQERTFIASEYIRSRVWPHMQQGAGFREIKDWYDQHANEFRTFDKVKWQDIFIATPNHGTAAEARRIAEQILERVRRGESFDSFLKYDEGDSWSYRKGEGNGQMRGQIKPPELEQPLFDMKDGHVGPLVELSTGFHVFRLLKRDVAGKVPFDDQVQVRIAGKLKNEIAEREYKRIVKELRERAVIHIERGAPK